MNADARPRLVDAEFQDIGDQRRSDRRGADRRVPRIRLDPNFAATLINQIATPEQVQRAGYLTKPKQVRPGFAFDLRA